MSSPPSKTPEPRSQGPIAAGSDAEIPITNREKLEISRVKPICAPALAAVYVSTGLKAIFRGPGGAESWHREVYTSISRRNARNGPESPAQRRWRWPSTGDVVGEYCKKEGVRVQAVELAHGARLHLLGVGASDGKVILWYHGELVRVYKL